MTSQAVTSKSVMVAPVVSSATLHVTRSANPTQMGLYKKCKGPPLPKQLF